MTKKIKKLSDFVTLGDLRETTKIIIKSVDKTCVTKDEFSDFKGEMLGFKQDMLGFKQDMLGFKQEVKGKFSEIIGMLSEVMGELKTIREEQTVGAYQIRRNFDLIEANSQEISLLKQHAGLT